jgi:N-sulfoglucosamine sulfohydrolase
VAPESVYPFNRVLQVDPRSTVEMAEACKGVITSDKPFFLYFCPDDPHRGHPFTPDSPDAPNTFGNRPEGYPGVKTVTYGPKDVIVPRFLPDTSECRAELAQYYQSVSRIDQGLGRLQSLLKEVGKTDNTVIIYISDNGIAFPGAKTTVYEPGIKLPCIVKDPRSSLKGIVNNAMISWVDLTPTILDFAGVKHPTDAFHGRSFVSVLGQTNPKGWDTVYAAHNFHEVTMYYPMRVIRDGDFKLIWNIAWRLEYPFASDLWAASTWQSVYRKNGTYFGQRTVQDYLFRPEFELYNLAEDSGESKNLASDPTYSNTLKRLQKQIKAFQVRTRDPWLIMWEHDVSLKGTGVNL